jgi:hypothetical protein
MRVSVLIISIIIIMCSFDCSAQAQIRTFSARAQSRAPRPCLTNTCLLKRIATLESEVAALKESLIDLGANSIKSGQMVTIKSPTGCLAYSKAAGISTGPVWWSNPCENGNWLIQPSPK